MWSYFNKIWLFSEDAFPLNSRVLFLDLDTCIVGDWSPLCKVPIDKPVMLKDLWAFPMPASGLMSWRATAATQPIWTDFKPWSLKRPPYFHQTQIGWGRGQNEIRTDEQWLFNYLLPDKWHAFQFLLPGMLASYKMDIVCTMKQNGRTNDPMTAERAKNLRVVYFHGRPRPHEVKFAWNAHYLTG
jgi:hypothetical protein